MDGEEQRKGMERDAVDDVDEGQVREEDDEGRQSRRELHGCRSMKASFNSDVKRLDRKRDPEQSARMAFITTRSVTTQTLLELTLQR